MINLAEIDFEKLIPKIKEIAKISKNGNFCQIEMKDLLKLLETDKNEARKILPIIGQFLEMEIITIEEFDFTTIELNKISYD